MLDIRLKIDPGQRKELESLLEHMPGAARKVMARALNRTLTGVKTGVVRAIRETYIIRQADVNKTLSVQQANEGRLFAWLRSRSTVISLDMFAYSPKSISPRPPIGVRSRVMRQNAAKAVPGMFLIPGRGLFHRQGEKRWYTYYSKSSGREITRFTEPIERNFGPSVSQMMESVLDMSPGGNGGIQERALTRLRKEIDHEIEHELLKGAGLR